MKLNYEQLKRLIGFDVKINGEWWHVFTIDNDGVIRSCRYDSLEVGKVGKDISPHVFEIQEIRHKQPPKFKVGDTIKNINTNLVTMVLGIFEDGDYKVLDKNGLEKKLYGESTVWIPHFDEPVREITKEEAEELLKEKGIDNIKIK